jgi:hypothetical protein
VCACLKQDIINTAEAQKLKEAAEGLMMKKTDQVTLFSAHIRKYARFHLLSSVDQRCLRRPKGAEMVSRCSRRHEELSINVALDCL